MTKPDRMLETLLEEYDRIQHPGRGGGSIPGARLTAAVERARRRLDSEITVHSLPWPFYRWWGDHVSFRCEKFPGAEHTALRKWILVSTAGGKGLCLENLGRAMRLIGATPDELAVGNRYWGPLRGGWGVACMFLPGTRRPLGNNTRSTSANGARQWPSPPPK